MGTFNINITAVGGHGCDRHAVEDEHLYLLESCERLRCPDRLAAELVRLLKGAGCSIESAKLTHWPNTEESVVDDINNMVRISGKF